MFYEIRFDSELSTYKCFLKSENAIIYDTSFVSVYVAKLKKLTASKQDITGKIWISN